MTSRQLVKAIPRLYQDREVHYDDCRMARGVVVSGGRELLPKSAERILEKAPCTSDIPSMPYESPDKDCITLRGSFLYEAHGVLLLITTIYPVTTLLSA